MSETTPPTAAVATSGNYYPCLFAADDNDDDNDQSTTSDSSYDSTDTSSVPSLAPAPRNYFQELLDSDEVLSINGGYIDDPTDADDATAVTEATSNCSSASPSPVPTVPKSVVMSAQVDNDVHFTFTNEGVSHLCFKAVHPETGELSEYRELKHSSDGDKWKQANANEFGRLAQGLPPDVPVGNNTFEFIHKHEVPKDKSVTYYRIVASFRPQKKDPFRIRGTAGGDRLSYDGPTSTKTSDLVTTKIMANHIVSTENCRVMCIDLKDFFLKTRLPGFEYMRISIDVIPEQVMKHYDLYDKVYDGYVYVRIGGGMYGLKQAGRIAKDALQTPR